MTPMIFAHVKTNKNALYGRKARPEDKQLASRWGLGVLGMKVRYFQHRICITYSLTHGRDYCEREATRQHRRIAGITGRLYTGRTLLNRLHLNGRAGISMVKKRPKDSASGKNMSSITANGVAKSSCENRKKQEKTRLTPKEHKGWEKLCPRGTK